MSQQPPRYYSDCSGDFPAISFTSEPSDGSDTTIDRYDEKVRKKQNADTKAGRPKDALTAFGDYIVAQLRSFDSDAILQFETQNAMQQILRHAIAKNIGIKYNSSDTEHSPKKVTANKASKNHTAEVAETAECTQNDRKTNENSTKTDLNNNECWFVMKKET